MAKSNAPKLTTKQVMAGFSVSDMTIYTWRAGTANRSKLPTHTEGNRVFFKEVEMAKYAKDHGLSWNSAAANAVPEAKMGPKATPAAKKSAPVKAAGKKVAKAKTVRETMASAPMPKAVRAPKAHAAAAAA